MMQVIASAPGKLVLLGEYAVLEGAPALVMAINRRARVRMTAQSDGTCEVSAPDLNVHNQPLRFAAGGTPDWGEDADAAKQLRLVDHILRGLSRASLTPPPARGCKLAPDPAAYFYADALSRPHLGLGSCAPLIVGRASP